MRDPRLPSNHPDDRIALAEPRRVANRARGGCIDQPPGSPLVSAAISDEGDRTGPAEAVDYGCVSVGKRKVAGSQSA